MADLNPRLWNVGRLRQLVECAALLVVGCFDTPDPTGRLCVEAEDCGPDFACIEETCVHWPERPLGPGARRPSLDSGVAGRCSDGRVSQTEACDDGNIEPGDGCEPTCIVTPGWHCEGEPSRCDAVCGDGLRLAQETCDDNNTSSSDGCSTACRVEAGFTCPGLPSICTPKDPDLILHLDLDNTQGKFIPDVSGSGFDATVLQSPVEWVSGFVQGGLRMNGAQSIVVPDVPYGHAHTLVLWARIDTALIPGRVALFHHGYSSEDMGYRLSVDATGKLEAQVRWSPTEAVRLSTSGALHDLTQWHRIAWVIAPGGEITLYLDGVHQDSVRGPSTPLDPTPNAILGADPGLDGGEVVGTFDDLRIYRRALSQAELLDLYRAAGGSGPVRLVARADTSVRGGMFADTAENLSSLRVARSSSPGSTWETYLRFDVEGLEKAATARLHLYAEQGALAGLSHGLGLVSDDTWTEADLTWNSRPPASSDRETWGILQTPGWIDIDLTAPVRTEAMGDNALSVRVRSVNDLGTTSFVTYQSRDQSERPHLEISF